MTEEPTDWALVVVDMQNDFLHAGGYYAQRAGVRQTMGWRSDTVTAVIGNVQRLVTHAKRVERPVIFVRAIYDRSFDVLPPSLTRNPARTDFPCKPNTWGAQLIDPIQSLSTDTAIVEKHTFDAFFATNLDAVLRSHNVAAAVFAGTETHVCVLVTAQHAALLGYRAAIATDACWTANDAAGNGALAIFRDAFGDTLTTDEIVGAP